MHVRTAHETMRGIRQVDYYTGVANPLYAGVPTNTICNEWETTDRQGDPFIPPQRSERYRDVKAHLLVRVTGARPLVHPEPFIYNKQFMIVPCPIIITRR